MYRTVLPPCPTPKFGTGLHLPPDPNPQTIRKVQSALRRLRAPKPKKAKVVPGLIVNPHNLTPIHLSKQPITADHHKESSLKRSINSTSIIDSQHISRRKKCRFIDDTAIESDGEGGSIDSANSTPYSTPYNTPPSSPPRTPIGPRNSNSKNKFSGKKPRSEFLSCILCTIKCNRVNQYKRHLQGKKHQKNLLKSKSTNPDFECELCFQEFDNYHNLSTHKCKKLAN